MKFIENIKSSKKTTAFGIASLIVVISKALGFDIESKIGIDINDIALAISGALLLFSKDYDK